MLFWGSLLNYRNPDPRRVWRWGPSCSSLRHFVGIRWIAWIAWIAWIRCRAVKWCFVYAKRLLFKCCLSKTTILQGIHRYYKDFIDFTRISLDKNIRNSSICTFAMFPGPSRSWKDPNWHNCDIAWTQPFLKRPTFEHLCHFLDPAMSDW